MTSNDGRAKRSVAGSHSASVGLARLDGPDSQPREYFTYPVRLAQSRKPLVF